MTEREEEILCVILGAVILWLLYEIWSSNSGKFTPGGGGFGGTGGGSSWSNNTALNSTNQNSYQTGQTF